jgi:hypothetical protein
MAEAPRMVIPSLTPEQKPADIERAIEAEFPGWHVWHSDAGRPYATRVHFPDDAQLMITLDAPGIGLMAHVIASFEHERACPCEHGGFQ